MYWLIILAAITLVFYGKAQSCSSANDGLLDDLIKHQYNNNIDCGNNNKCKGAVTQFADTAALTTNELSSIINEEEFKFHPDIYEQNENFETIMGKFSPICQRYTDVMAHKYHFQQILFNGPKLNNATVIIKVVLVIMKLQVMANSLQTAQLDKDGDNCLKFTTSQYGKIYYSRLQYWHPKSQDQLDAACLLQMRTRNWQDKNNN